MPVRQAGIRPLTPPGIAIVPGLPPVLPPTPPPPPPAVHLSALTLTVATIEAGQDLTGTVTLEGAAPSGGILISLGSDQGGVAVPASVQVLEGQTAADFPITTEEAASAFTATITATDQTVTLTTTLAVTATPEPPPPPPPDTTAPTVPTALGVTAITRTTARVSWTASTDDVAVGSYGVYLNGLRVLDTPGLTADLLALTCATVYTVTVDAVDAAGNRSAASVPVVFTTQDCEAPPPPPPPDPPELASFTLSAATVVGGSPVMGTVTIDRLAPAGGTPVALASSATGVAQVPPTVLVLAGQTTATVPITTTGQPTPQTVTLTASTALQTRSVALTVTALPVPPPSLTLTSLTVAPSSVVGGISSALTARLSGVAGSGGVAVALASNNPRLAEVPTTLLVPAGQQQAVTSITTRVPALAPASLRTVASPAMPVGGTLVTNEAELTAALLLGGTIRLAPNTTFTGQFAVGIAGTQLLGGANSKISGGSAGTPALLVTADTVLIQGDPTTGLELAGPTTDQAVFRGGLNTTAQNTLDSVPDGLTLVDVRILSHRGKCGFEINSANVTLINCWAINIWHSLGNTGPDSSALRVLNTQGPVTIRGGKFSAGSEVIIVGGDTLKIPGDTTSTILIEDADIFRPLSWKTDGVSRKIKNLVELKRGSGVTLRRCHIHGCWFAGAGQDGEALVFTPSDRCVVENVIVEDCGIWDVGGGLEYLGRGQNTHTPRPLSVTIRRTLFVIDKATFGGFGMFARGGAEPDLLSFSDNTILLDGSAIVDHFAGTVIESDDVTTRPGGKITRLEFTGNRAVTGTLGLRFLGFNNGDQIANAVNTWDVSGNTFGGLDRMKGNFPTNTYLDRPTFDQQLAARPGVVTAVITGSLNGVSRSALLTVTSPIAPPPPGGNPHHYFETVLRGHPNHLRSWALRTQAEIDCNNRTTCGLVNVGRDLASGVVPPVYDPVADAMRSEIHPQAGVQGSTDAEGRRCKVDVTGTSLLITWDLRIDPSFAWSTGKIGRSKAYRFIPAAPDGSKYWFVIKLDYQDAVKDGNRGIARIDFTAAQCPLWAAPPTTCAGEHYHPKANLFYVQPNVWTRVWVLADGVIGNGAPLSVSAWAADETRDAVLLYDALQMDTPANGFHDFLLSLDSSQESTTTPNDIGATKLMWHRNVAVLTGLTRATTLPLLTRPVAG